MSAPNFSQDRTHRPADEYGRPVYDGTGVRRDGLGFYQARCVCGEHIARKRKAYAERRLDRHIADGNAAERRAREVTAAARRVAGLSERLRATAAANEIIVNWPLEAKLLREAADELDRLQALIDEATVERDHRRPRPSWQE